MRDVCIRDVCIRDVCEGCVCEDVCVRECVYVRDTCVRDVCMQEGSNEGSGYNWTHVTRWRDDGKAPTLWK